MAIYIFLDTSIFVWIVSQGKPGCEVEQFTALKTLVEGGAVRLLVPEVVILELEKCSRTFAADLEPHCAALKASISKPTVWSEIQDIQNSLLESLDQKRRLKLETAVHNFKAIQEWLASDKAQILPFTSEIWFSAKRRIMAGRYPRSQGKADQDCSIIESLISFFKGGTGEAAELYFCSENHQDFTLELESKDKTRTFVIHPDFQEGLPAKTHYFLTLDALMGFARGYEQFVSAGNGVTVPFSGVTVPFNWDTDWTKTSGIAWQDIPCATAIISGGALGLTANTNRNFTFHSGKISPLSVAGSSYIVSLGSNNLQYDPEIAQQFETEVIPKLSPGIVELRQSLTKEIQDTLTACRQCASWDAGSEHQLPQWLDFVPEKMIPYAALTKLVEINANLGRYLQAHRAADVKLKEKLIQGESPTTAQPQPESE